MIWDKGKLALIALAFPYIVDIVLVLSLSSFIGIEGYRSNPKVWHMFGTAIILVVKVAIVVSWLLTIPFCLERSRRKTVEEQAQVGKCILAVIAYIVVNILNTVLIVVFHAIVWAASGGVI